MFRAEPEAMFPYAATREQDERLKEIDEMSAALLRFPDASLAGFTCSFSAADRSTFEVIGTKGVVKMDPAYEMVGDLKSEITIEGRTQKATYKKRDQFGPEMVYFSKCVLEDLEPEPGEKEGLADVHIIRALVESQQKERPVRISPVGEVTPSQRRPGNP